MNGSPGWRVASGWPGCCGFVFELLSIRTSHRALALGEVVGWHTSLLSWVAASVGGLLAGRSSKSTGEESDEQPRFNAIEIAATVGPYVFIAGLLLLVSALAEVLFRPGRNRRRYLFASLATSRRWRSVGSSPGESTSTNFLCMPFIETVWRAVIWERQIFRATPIDLPDSMKKTLIRQSALSCPARAITAHFQFSAPH